MTEWAFRGIKHKAGEIFPDGTDPSVIRRKWEPFIDDCLMLLDGDGTFRHWKYAGAYADQPWIDIHIYRSIRGKWVELKNKDMNGKWGNLKGSNGGIKPGRKPSLRRRV